MERDFDRETYLNKEKYDEALREEERKKKELISERVRNIQKAANMRRDSGVIFRILLKWKFELLLQRMME